MSTPGPFRTVHLPLMVTKLYEAYPNLATVHLFGSRVYRTGSLRSDIDLLLTFREAVAMPPLGEMAYELEPYLDVFVAQDGVAVSAINGSIIHADSFDELVAELDAQLLWESSHWIAGDNIDTLEQTVLADADPAKTLAAPGGVHMKTIALPPLCDVLVIAALKDEYDAVAERLTDVRVRQAPAHVPPFSIGNIESGGVERPIAMALLTRMGGVSAALTTRRLLDYLSPQLVVLVGIAGGIRKQDVKLGDVVMPGEIYEYEAVKVTPEGERNNSLITPVAADLYARVKMWDSDRWRARISRQMPSVDRRWCARLRRRISGQQIALHFDEAMASGHKVIADEERANSLTLMSRKTSSIEMESFGVAEACRQAHLQTPFLVIKAIADYADAVKDDSWRAFCCAASADLLTTLLIEGVL